MNFLIYALAFITILGAAVVLHEFGHFIVAKMLGIRVEVFSVGFGSRIFGRRFGTTDYRLSLIPLGGYVKLGGDESNAAVEGASASNIPDAERFDLRPRFHKFLVIIAGPIMNIMTAFMILFVSAMTVGVPVEPQPVISRVTPGGAAERAGIQPGDRVVSFNGKENPTWERISGDSFLAPEQDLPVVVERSGQRLPLTIKPTKRIESGEVLGDPDMRPDFGNLPVTVAQVEEGSPAAEAGLKVGDRITMINGETVRSEQQVVEFIQSHRQEPIRLGVARANNEELEITASVRRLSDGRERLGFMPGRDLPLERVGPIAATTYSINRNVELVRLTAKAIGQIFTGQRSARDTLSGPIGIARATATAVSAFGWDGFFRMFLLLSLNLGILNLLPIPVLDGGAIMILAIEAMLGVVGISLSLKLRERIQQVGFVVLLLIMGSTIFNDLIKEAARLRSNPEAPPAATAPPSK